MDPKTSKYRFVIAGIILLFNLLYGANFAAIAPILTLIIDQYGVSRGEASFLVSGALVMQAVLVIPGGMLVARAPLKLVFGIGCATAGAMCFVFLADHFLALLALRLVYALAFVVVMPATAPILMRWFRLKELPIVNSLHMTSFTLGIALGTFTVAPLSVAFGWQTILSGFGAAMLSAGLVWAFLGRIPAASQQSVVKRVSFGDMGRMIRSRTILLLGIADGCAFAFHLVMITWLPSYYNQVGGMSLSQAGYTVGLIPMVGVFASLAGGALSAWIGLRRPFLVVPGLLVGLAGFGSFLFQNDAIIYISMVGLGIANFMYLPVLLTIPLELKGISEGQAAVAWATLFAVAGGIGIIGPITVGFMTDHLGSFVPGFTLWAILSSGLLLVGLMVPETGPRARLSRRRKRN